MRKAGILVLIIIILGGVTAFIIRQRRFSPPPDSGSIVPIVAETANIPDDWRTYENELGYRIKMPPKLLVDTEVGENSIRLVPTSQSGEFGQMNFIYISVVRRDDIGKENRVYNYNSDQFLRLMDIDVGDKRSIISKPRRGPDLSEWFVYERLEDTKIDGNQTRVFLNRKPWEFPLGVAEIRYVIPTEDIVYILGGYFGGDVNTASLNRNEVAQTVSTFSLVR